MKKRFISVLLIFLLLFSYSPNVNAASLSNDKLNELDSFIIGNMWNDCICNFSWYYGYRTDACGDAMNPDKVLAKYNKTMRKAKKWNSSIN